MADFCNVLNAILFGAFSVHNDYVNEMNFTIGAQHNKYEYEVNHTQPVIETKSQLEHCLYLGYALTKIS